MKAPVVFLRGGGLGDFILILPLVKLAYQRGHSVRLYARSHYTKLLDSKWSWIEVEDIDELEDEVVDPKKLAEKAELEKNTVMWA